MNISVTNTKVLKRLVALAVICASAQAFAATVTSDSFETYTAGDAITNAAPTVWMNQGAGLSTVVETNYTYTAATMPLSATVPGTLQTKVLSLDTQGDELSNANATVDAPIVYIDQMVYLVPSNTEPTITDDSVQAAVYLNSSSNLVVYCRDTNDTGNVWTVLDGTNVLPETWVRLTITMDYDTGDDDFYSIDTDWIKVTVDGTDVTASLGYSAIEATTGLIVPTVGGAWLRAANLSGGSATLDALSGLSYTGTGMIDDLVVTTTAPTFEPGTGGPSTFSIVSVVGANGGISTDLDFTIDAGGSTSITFTAANYYEIASLEINGAAVTDTAGNEILFTTNHFESLVVPYDTVGANVSNNVTFTEILSDLSSAPASWFEGVLGLTPEGDDGTTPYSYKEGYLAGVNPTVSNAFTITSFSVSNGVLTVEWEGVSSPATPTAISAIVAETVGGLSTTNAGTAAYSAPTWSWESAGSDFTNGTLFIKLQAAD